MRSPVNRLYKHIFSRTEAAILSGLTARQVRGLEESVIPLKYPIRYSYEQILLLRVICCLRAHYSCKKIKKVLMQKGNETIYPSVCEASFVLFSEQSWHQIREGDPTYEKLEQSTVFGQTHVSGVTFRADQDKSATFDLIDITRLREEVSDIARENNTLNLYKKMVRFL